MLIQCPECDLQVSDKANTCPHCGYPLKPDAKPKSSRKPNKRRRLPNGFGQISEIKGRNLRNPFRAMVTVGKDKNGKPICKPLKPESYFPTYNDAYTALVEFNKNPYDLEPSITVKELYDKWTPEYFKTLKSDDRKHFVTKCKDAKVDEYAIKYMVGHKISDITEKVYTAREFEWLRTEIEKIK